MKKLSIIIAGLLSHNANAAWGQNWGSMVWGQTSANVPMMDGIANIIFFGSLLALGVVTLNRWGLIKTLPILAVLSFIPSLVDADEIQLNAFQNGEVADADEVNENFIALKEALEELNEKVKSISCNAIFSMVTMIFALSTKYGQSTNSSNHRYVCGVNIILFGNFMM